MKRGVAFEAAGYKFGPLPEGWESLKLVESPHSPRELYLVGITTLGRTHTVVVSFSQMALRLAREGVGSMAWAAIQTAFEQFSPIPLDALDVLRAAHEGVGV